tara:strand:+ start:182 stop:1174 length:993 start_codon:yes stop_codon:yes gene_type:complete
MKALVISGGGSKGAFAGGIVDYLTNVKNRDYELYVSSSTGTLVQLLVASDNIDKLKEGYTTVKNEDIWRINPFKVKTNLNGKVKMQLNWFNVIRNLLPTITIKNLNKFPYFKINKINGKLSFGDSSNLIKLIKKFLSLKEYLRIKEELNKELVVCVVNATLKEIEYKSSNDWGYDDFCDWTHASCSAYPFMSPIIKNDYQYMDGAILETVPIQEAINRGATEIDIIILKEEEPKKEIEYIRNLVHGLITEIDMMYTELSKNDIVIGKLKAKNEDIILNFYYTPRRLTNNSLIFDKEIMSNWWVEGYNYAKERNNKTYKMVKGRKTKLLKN